MALAQLKSLQVTLSQEVETFKSIQKGVCLQRHLNVKIAPLQVFVTRRAADVRAQQQARQQYLQQEQENNMVMKASNMCLSGV